MKPLASPTAEFATIGVGQLLAGGAMYLLAYRRFTRQVPDGRSRLRSTSSRSATEDFLPVGAMLAGNGVALLLVVRLMHLSSTRTISTARLDNRSWRVTPPNVIAAGWSSEGAGQATPGQDSSTNPG